MTLCFILLDSSEMLKRKKVTKEPSGEDEKLSVLVVDDDDTFRYLVKELLQSKYVMEFASDGNTGVKKALSNSYDIILMDLQMPGIDGIEATNKIWEKKPDQIIIIVSAMRIKNLQLKNAKLLLI